MKDHSIRLLLVEDHPLYRTGLRMALSYSDSNVIVVHESDSKRDAMDYIIGQPEDFNFVLLDYFLPDGNGMDLIEVIKKYNPEAKVLVISADTNNPAILTMVDQGVNGFISKDVNSQELSVVINSISHGHNYYDNNLVNMLETRLANQKRNDSLSERELDIIRLCVKGLTAKQIAEQLDISPRTVEKHKDHIFSKLNITSTVDLVHYAMEHKLN